MRKYKSRYPPEKTASGKVKNFFYLLLHYAGREYIL